MGAGAFLREALLSIDIRGNTAAARPENLRDATIHDTHARWRLEFTVAPQRNDSRCRIAHAGTRRSDFAGSGAWAARLTRRRDKIVV